MHISLREEKSESNWVLCELHHAFAPIFIPSVLRVCSPLLTKTVSGSPLFTNSLAWHSGSHEVCPSLLSQPSLPRVPFRCLLLPPTATAHHFHSNLDWPWKKRMPSSWQSPRWHSTAASNGNGIPGNSSCSNFGYPFSFFSWGYTQTLSPCIKTTLYLPMDLCILLFYVYTYLWYITLTQNPPAASHILSPSVDNNALSPCTNTYSRFVKIL